MEKQPGKCCESIPEDIQDTAAHNIVAYRPQLSLWDGVSLVLGYAQSYFLIGAPLSSLR